jgi:hypothetical protein
MKIRNGFVSNSSSSSFIVAFDSKPESVEGLVKTLFGPGSTPDEIWKGGLTKSEVAERVFDDINKQKKSLTEKEVAEAFSYRYWMGLDPENPKFVYSNLSNWWGLDFYLLMDMRTLCLNHEREEKAAREKEWSFIEEKIGKSPRYNTEGYEEWHKKLDKLSKTKKYKEMKAKSGDLYSKFYKDREKLSKKLAKYDAKSFVEDNKGCYIYQFTYGDENGPFEGELEHGRVFNRLPSVCIDQH